MADTGGTPAEYGLRVRTDPKKELMVTALNKMRSGVEVPISYSEELVQLVYYSREEKVHQANFAFTSEFIRGLDDYKTRGTSYLWHDVPGDRIVGLLSGMVIHPLAIKPAGAVKYIKDMIIKGELTDWSVLLASNAKPDGRILVGDLDVGLTDRTEDSKKSGKDPNVYVINRSNIYSPSDEYEDLKPDEFSKALELTRANWANPNRRGKRSVNAPDKPTGKSVRQVRDPRRGMLILYALNPVYVGDDLKTPVIGYAISFPQSPTAEKTNYLLNEVAQGKEIEDEE
jgi:hypothetical protein